VLNGVCTAIRAGFALVVPAGAQHNIINTGTVPLKLYTLYAPPNHRDGVVHRTRADADADSEHFDGKTTE
jgi:mannose-6-phosphate isomerase-like protein (cupin superfamily)